MTLSGRGEPTLHPRLGDMLDYCKGKFFDLKMNTNATRLNETLMHKIIEAGVTDLVFSVDSYEKELLPDARENLNNKIKYVGAKIALGINVDEHINEFLNNGELFFLLCFISYPNEQEKEYGKYANFILKCKEAIFSKFEKLIEQTTIDGTDVFIQEKVKEFLNQMRKPN